jgi:hypothetical protein
MSHTEQLLLRVYWIPEMQPVCPNAIPTSQSVASGHRHRCSLREQGSEVLLAVIRAIRDGIAGVEL